jgi:hypothetical protein
MLNTTDLHEQHVEIELESIEARLAHLEDAVVEIQASIHRLAEQRDRQQPGGAPMQAR